MNKKFMNALLFSAALLSAGVVTSCKDYDDDIDELRELINQNATLGETLQTQLNTLQSAAQAAQTAADNAAAEAKAAAAAADEAKAQAAAAQSAAEQAKADAIAAAAADLEAYKAEVTELLGAKADATALDELDSRLTQELADLAGKIEGIESGLADEITSALDVRITSNTNEINNIKDLLATLTAGATDLEVQKATLEKYAALLSENGLQADITEVSGRIDNAVADINTLKSKVEANTTDLNAAKADINTLKTDVAGIRSDITEINGDLAQLHILVAARLNSITFAPNAFVDGVEAIVFNSLEYGDMSKFDEKYDLLDEYKDVETITYENPDGTTTEVKVDMSGNNGMHADFMPAQYSTAALATASYHFNPSSFNLDNADYQYIDRQVEVITTRSNVAATNLLQIEGTPVANVEKGTVDFQLRRLDTPNTSDGNALDKVNTVALQATLKGDAVDEGESNVVITSPYVRVYDDVVDQRELFIADKESLETVGDKAHFASVVTMAQAEPARYEMVYDKEFNLKELIATCLNKEDDDADLHNALDIEAYKLSYRFAVAETEYKVTTGSTTTNQQTVVKCKDAENGIFVITDGFGRETIGRTPILRVELVDEAGRVVRRGFVKVKVVAEKAADYVAGIVKDLTYDCEDTQTKFELDEEWMRQNVYRQIESSRGDVSLSHEEFWNMYEYDHVDVTKDGEPFSGTAPEVVDGSASAGVATKKVVWNIIHRNLGEISEEGSVFIGSVTLKNKLAASEFPAYITLNITVNVTLPALNPEFTINKVYWNETQTAFVSNVNRPASETDYASNCQFQTKLSDAFATVKFDEKLPKCHAEYFRLAGIYNGEEKMTTGGVEIEGNTAADQIITLDKDNEAIKSALNSEDGLSAVVEYVVEFESGDVVVANTFNVEFVTPVSLNMPEGKTVMDAKTGGDVVDFGGYQMLTDWRGYTITAPETTTELVQWGFWAHNRSAHKTTVIPGWVETIRPAYWDIKFKDVEILSGEKAYGGSVTVTYVYREVDTNSHVTFGTKEVSHTYSVEARYDSPATVETELNKLVLAGITENCPAASGNHMWVNEKVRPGLIDYTEGVVATTTTVKAIESIKYYPAITKSHAPKVIVEKAHTAVKPNYEGKAGDIVGCWQWIAKENTQVVTSYGAYWDFYGVFGDLKLDTANATTDLDYNGGKLPSTVTLTQVGNTVKYENVGTPVGYSYKINIPASIEYGWGVAETTLTITVNPAGAGE